MHLYNLMIASGLKESLQNFSARHNLKMSEVVRMAIVEFMENHRNDVVNEDGIFVERNSVNA